MLKLSQFTEEILFSSNFYVVLYLFLLLIPVPSFAQWTNQNPVPDGNHLRAVYFINDSTGWMAGSGGYIAKTTNYGEVWQKQNSGTDLYLKQIKFLNEDIGIVVGENGLILRTNDGGINWTLINTFVFEDFNGIALQSGIGFWVVGNNATLIHSSDGFFWRKIELNISDDLENIFFVDNSVGWICGGSNSKEGVILKTTNGGLEWIINRVLSTSMIFDLHFFNKFLGFAAGFDFQLLKTTDGGLSWIEQDYVSSPHLKELREGGFTDIHFIDSNNGWIVGGDMQYSNIILRTADGGLSWHIEYSGTKEYPIYSVWNINSNLGYVVGSNGRIFKISNESKVTQLFSGSGNFSGDCIQDICYISDSTGFAVGKRNNLLSGLGVILKTTNSGKNWLTSNLTDICYEINSVDFIDDNYGWAINSEEGVLFYTSDGGINWNSSPLYINMQEIDFINQTTGFIAGDKILKTIDGGISWNEKSSHQSNSIYFINDNTGWSCGNNGAILSTTDGGENWSPKVSGTNADLRSVKFYNNMLGICVGDNGVIVLTYDGGESWVSKTNGINADLRSAAFVDDKIIWITGENGTLISTTDAGDYWTTNYSLTSKDLNTVFFIDHNSGWIGGNDGTIFKYNYESVVPVELISFTAEVLNDKVLLNWQTASEMNNSGFEIERNTPLNPLSRGEAEGRGVWEKIGFVNGVGTTSDLQSYTYTDEKLIPGKYRYRLKQIDLDGSFEYSDEIEVVISTPKEFVLEQNYPNPFNPSTRIQYQVSGSSQVTLKVYDILGNKVATLVNEFKPAGSYQIDFSATDGASQLASGVYIYKLETGDFTSSKKMVLLR